MNYETRVPPPLKQGEDTGGGIPEFKITSPVKGRGPHGALRPNPSLTKEGRR